MNKKMIDGLRQLGYGLLLFCDGIDEDVAKSITASASKPVAAPTVTTPEPGSFTDKRDGQTYRTVKMPDGKVWMAQNLNYKPETGNAWAYDDDETNRAKYGLLYDWETAKVVVPGGWHLPSRAEWQELVDACGGKEVGTKLKAKTGWDSDGSGTDDYGFTALPGGNRYSDDIYNFAGYYGRWWTATEHDGSNAYFWYMYYYYAFLYEYYYLKESGFAVRCVGD